MSSIKLSKKQREIISYMREFDKGFAWRFGKYVFKGETVRYDTGNDLIDKGIVSCRFSSIDYAIYELTELGKTIKL